MLYLALTLLKMAIRYPKVINAPGGRMNKSIVFEFSATIGMLKIDPFPSSSRIEAISVIAKVKPIPIPKPSNIALFTSFF